MVQQMKEWQRRFALAKVLPERLAQRSAVRRVIQRVISDLERDAQILSEAEQASCWASDASARIAPIRQEAAISPAVLCSTILI